MARSAPRWWRSRAAAALLALATALLLAAPAPAQAGHRPGPGRSWIAFTSDRDTPDRTDVSTTNDDIYLMDPRSGRTVRLTTAPSGEQVPVISPDGRQLLFQSTRSTRDLPNPEERWALYRCRLHLDTPHPWCGRAHRITGWTPLGAPVNFLAWVPGARSVLYSTEGSIFRLDLRDGAAPVPLLGLAAGEPDAVSRPSLSRDGRVLVYTSLGDLWRARPDGSDRVRLTSTALPLNEGGPQVSPDGTRVAFTSNRRSAPALDYDIWVMDAVPESPTNVPVDLTAGLQPPPFVPCANDPVPPVPPASQERYPVWSPDGRQIAFPWYDEDSLAPGAGYDQGEIYRVDADGGRLRNLTRNYLPGVSRCDPAQIGDIQPDWGPRGTGSRG